jgi:hypothetical protein
VMRSLGVAYLNARTSEVLKLFHPRVVKREGSVRTRQEVCQLSMTEVIEGGKSEPASTIQDTVLERGGGEKSRAPRAE